MRNEGHRAQYCSVLLEQYHSLAQERINNKKILMPVYSRVCSRTPPLPSSAAKRVADALSPVNSHRVVGAALENDHPSSASGCHDSMAYFASALAVRHTLRTPHPGSGPLSSHRRSCPIELWARLLVELYPAWSRLLLRPG
jgi:hypothetical protein